jgi:hypothetical protein
MTQKPAVCIERHHHGGIFPHAGDSGLNPSAGFATGNKANVFETGQERDGEAIVKPEIVNVTNGQTGQ